MWPIPIKPTAKFVPGFGSVGLHFRPIAPATSFGVSPSQLRSRFARRKLIRISGDWKVLRALTHNFEFAVALAVADQADLGVDALL